MLRSTLLTHTGVMGDGPGNAMLLTLAFENVTEVATAFGRTGVSAETVAEEAVRSALDYMTARGPHKWNPPDAHRTPCQRELVRLPGHPDLRSGVVQRR